MGSKVNLVPRTASPERRGILKKAAGHQAPSRQPSPKGKGGGKRKGGTPSPKRPLVLTPNADAQKPSGPVDQKLLERMVEKDRKRKMHKAPKFVQERAEKRVRQLDELRRMA